MARIDEVTCWSHPEAKVPVQNPYFGDVVWSQQVLPPKPVVNIGEGSEGERSTQQKVKRWKWGKRGREKKRKPPPSHSKEVYEFIDL